jgi:hypothetical protein
MQLLALKTLGLELIMLISVVVIVKIIRAAARIAIIAVTEAAIITDPGNKLISYAFIAADLDI